MSKLLLRSFEYLTKLGRELNELVGLLYKQALSVYQTCLMYMLLVLFTYVMMLVRLL